MAIPRVVNQPRVPIRITARSLLLVSSGVVKKCEKESTMAKFRKRMMKWGLSAAKVGLAATILAAPAVSAQASEFDGFEGLDFGALVQRGLERSSIVWFGVGRPLKESAPSTPIENYRTQAQRASDQVVLAEGLKAEYVTRNAGNGADMFAFWPSDEAPTHLIFCIENGRQNLGTFLPGGLLPKFNPAVQRIKLSDGSVDTILRGTIACDGIRRTPWQTILATEEASDGGVYEIINPLSVTNQTITDRTLGTIIDENGLSSTSIVKRTALPTMAWEGIGITSEGAVYAGDELRPGTPANADGGAMFKFVPANPRTVTGPIVSLSESPLTAGNVYALQVSCQSTSQQFGQGCEIGNGAWINVSAANARTDANTAGATGYYRPEDLERDPDFAGPGTRFCWTNTGLADGGNYGEVLCAVDSAPLVADPAQRTVVVNRFVEGDQDMNQPDNFAFQPKTGNHYVIEDNPNGDIFACLPDGGDRDIKTDGCIKILSVKDTSAEPTGFKFTADGRTAYLSIQHSHDGQMPKFDDYVTDDIIKITGFKIPFRFQR